MIAIRPLLAAAAVLALSAPVLAMQPAPLPAAAKSARFQALDRDGNGCIDRAEAERAAGGKALAAAWLQYDVDGSGRIDSAEFSAFEEMQGDERK